MELKGFKEFDKILVEIKEKAPQATGKFLMLQAEDLKKDAKELTPVDTGTLKNAWQRENGKRLTGNTFSQIVFNMRITLIMLSMVIELEEAKQNLLKVDLCLEQLYL